MLTKIGKMSDLRKSRVNESKRYGIVLVRVIAKGFITVTKLLPRK